MAVHEGSAPRATTGDVYRLGYRWLIKGPIDVTFELLSHGETFPEWWAPCFQSAYTDDPEPAVGTRIRYRVRSRLPYTLDWDVTVTRLEPPRLIEVDAFVRLSGRFPMRGPIRYTLIDGPGGVEVINEQSLTTSRRLPGPLRLLAQRAFAYNHAWAFQIGERGLQEAVDQAVAARAAGSSDAEA